MIARPLRAVRSLALSCLLLPALAACGNPALDDKIAELPADGVTPSAFHRGGQPCVLCHGAYKGASPEMIIGGTIFAQQPTGNGKPIPVPGVKITITDALGNVNGAKPPATREITTNCAGNFYLTHDDVFHSLALDTIAFPLKVEIECPNGKFAMNGRISREGSCGGCHAGTQNQGSPGVVVCGATTPAPTPQSCPQLFQ